MLDNTVYYTVVKMGSYVNGLAAVGVTWDIMRNVGNIMLIFGFLAAGIMTILNAEHYGFGRSMIPKLLLAAVFLNFSLFIAEGIVDTGNLFGTHIYTQINGGAPAGEKTLSLSSINQEGISNKIMSSLGLQTIYGQARDPNLAKVFFDNSWTIGFMSIFLFIIAAFVIFSLAFILIARFVILLFLIITSPAGFAGLAIPKLSNIANTWWKTLVDQTITAPVLLLGLYIALVVITDANFLTGYSRCVPGSTATGGCQDPNYLGFLTNNWDGFASVLLSFLVGMGLLLGVVVLSKRMSAWGGDWATKMGGRLSFGVAGFAGRYSVGLGAHKLAKYARSTRLARVPLVGTGLVRGLDKISGASFDARGAQFGGGLKGLGVDVGDAQKGGYKEALKKGIESRTKYAGELKGRAYEDLKEEAKKGLAERENQLRKYEKDRKDAKTADEYLAADKNVKEQEKKIDEYHEKIGTERGNKLKYAKTLSRLVLSSNTEAAKKIKEDARKSKDDKELDTLRKALKKAGGEDESTATAAPSAGAPTGGGTPSAGGGGGGGAPAS